jgi:O-Antigen ligase
MISLRNLIICSTYPALFSSALFIILGGVNIQFFYVFMIFNLVLMLYLGKLWVPLGLLALVAFVLASGAIGIARTSDTLPLFGKQLAGISISAFYFCCFVQLMDWDISECFRKYAHTAYYVAVVGIILFPFQFIYFGIPRLQSVLTEPSMFATTCLPALYYFADQWQRHRRDRRKFLVLGLAFALAGSSVGFLGIMFAVCIFGRRYKSSAVLIPAAVALMGIGVYALSPDFRMRLDDTKKSGQTFDVSGANLSTFALVSNAYVTLQSVKDHPLFGTGAGSHQLSYEKFISTLPGVEQWENTEFLEINAADANSLFLRVLSEFGLVGIALVLWFIWHYRAREGQGAESVSEAIWVYFFVKLLRGGVYFSPEQFFFIVLYAVNRGSSRDPKLSTAMILEHAK